MEEAQALEHSPLPISKHTRVWFEAVRTLAALTQVTINALIALKVFGKI